MTDTTSEVLTLIGALERLNEFGVAIKELNARYDELKARVDVLSQTARKHHPSAGKPPNLVYLDEYQNGGME